MSYNSKIEWTETSWNPVTGCTQISPGCAHCYAKAIVERFGGVFENIVLHPERLEQPLHWRKPRRVFVNSMSDLFHEQIPFDFIDQVFAVMALTPHHTYQVLTKRPERMQEYVNHRSKLWGFIEEQADVILVRLGRNEGYVQTAEYWPLPNVWLGVTVENQRWADERIPILLDTPAAVRFVSAEPLLSPIEFEHVERESPTYSFVWPSLSGEWAPDETPPHGGRTLDWVIVGGESGPKHRPFNPHWARSMRDQCAAAGVAFFMKQMSGFRPVRRLEDLPEDLQIREYPHGARS